MYSLFTSAVVLFIGIIVGVDWLKDIITKHYESEGKKDEVSTETNSKTSASMCVWQSPDGKYSCSRNKYNDSDYCLFHKPDKNHDETVLFWKVLTFKVFNGIRPEDNLDVILFHHNPAEFQRRFEQFIRKTDASIKSNFQNNESPQEKDAIINLVKQKINNFDIRYQTCLDFKGFIFPACNGYDFFNKVENVPFIIRARTTECPYDFSYCEFKFTTNFYGFKFMGRTKFDYTKFHGVTFDNAIFHGISSFEGTKFSRTNHYMDCGMFINTEFRGKIALFKDTEFLDLSGAVFAPNCNLHLEYDSENTRGDQEINLKVVKEHYRKQGKFEKQVDLHYKELHSKMFDLRNNAKLKDLKSQVWSDIKQTCRLRKKVISYDYYWNLIKGNGMLIHELTTGYLLRPQRILLTMFLTFLFFSSLYFFGDIRSSADDILISELNISERVVNSLYLSASTFTTLGNSNFIPYSIFMKSYCILECLLGIFLSSLFIVSLAKQVLRE